MAIKILSRLFIGIIIIVTGLAGISCGKSAPEPAPVPAPSPTPAPAPVPETIPEVKIMQWDSPPPMVIDTSKKYTAYMETVKGTLVLELFAKDVPRTVNNFVFLAREGYYDGTTFHRVLPDFMAQGGDPTGTGRGSPGYRFEDEFTEHGHDAGALSMANAGPNTNGSQFFITYVPVHQLDGKHTVFGKLIEGMDVLKSITPRDPSQNPNFEGDKIIRVTIKES
jgi:peptidyl-prolyl cis-trans isomerase B (cyclophilin B)